MAAVLCIDVRGMFCIKVCDVARLGYGSRYLKLVVRTIHTTPFDRFVVNWSVYEGFDKIEVIYWGSGEQSTIFNAAAQSTVEHGGGAEYVVSLCSDKHIL